jgi:hypothetical protein
MAILFRPESQDEYRMNEFMLVPNELIRPRQPYIFMGQVENGQIEAIAAMVVIQGLARAANNLLATVAFTTPDLDPAWTIQGQFYEGHMRTEGFTAPELGDGYIERGYLLDASSNEIDRLIYAAFAFNGNGFTILADDGMGEGVLQ